MTKQQANKAAKLVAKLQQELAQAETAKNWDLWDAIQEMMYNAKTYGQTTPPVYVYDNNGVRVGYELAHGRFVSEGGMTFENCA
jgi:hypothetical protein